MATEKNPQQTQRGDHLVAEARRNRALQEKTYRERALKMFPWVCARCGREFSGKKIRQLTVHHKDHNHDNNPPDGSNWELLCLYCHDNEHARDEVAEWYDASPSGDDNASGSGYRPFAGLEELLKDKR